MEKASESTDNQAVVFSSGNVVGSKKVILRLVVLLVIVVIVVVGVILIRSSSSNLSTYTFTNNAGSKYQIKFYRNSTPKQYGFGDSNDQDALVSPVIKSGGVPIAITMGGFTGNITASNDSKTLLNINKACALTPGAKPSFSVLVKSLGVSATFCDQQQVYYYSYFGTGSSIYYIQIAPYDTQFTLGSSFFDAADVRSAPNENEVKAIASSFKFISSKKD